jgi:hypothetical protein
MDLAERPGLLTRPTAPSTAPAAPPRPPAVSASVAPVAGSAVLVDLHGDLRLSIATLAQDTGAIDAEQDVAVARPGYLELVPAAGEPPLLGRLRVDARGRLRLTQGLAHRLGVPTGGRVLVRSQPARGSLALVNLAVVDEALTEWTASRCDSDTDTHPVPAAVAGTDPSQEQP